MKFRKKPVVIEAVQWTGTDKSFVEIGKLGLNPARKVSSSEYSLVIPTLEGNMTASKGDWIIKGVKNEFYPCKPDIFEATYEAVEE